MGILDSIAIELARDLPLGQEGYSEINQGQKKNQDINERINRELEKLGVDCQPREQRTVSLVGKSWVKTPTIGAVLSLGKK